MAAALLFATAGCDDGGSSEPRDIVTGLDTGQSGDASDTSSDATPDDADALDDVERDQQSDSTDARSDLPDEGDLGDIADGTDAPDGAVQPETRDCLTTVAFDGAPNAGSVHVAGSFNGWDPDITPLERDPDGVWRTEIDLAPGSYPHKFVIDGVWEDPVPPDVYTQWDGDVENRSLRVGDCTRPLWRPIDVSVSDDGIVSGEIQLVRANDGAPLDPDTVELSVGGAPVTPIIDDQTSVVSFEYAAPDYGKYSIRLDGADTDGDAAENNTLFLPLWYEASPFTWQDALLYLIFTDRFRDTDGIDQRIAGVEERANYLGGDFRGITQAIDEGYFERLGVNALWLSPMYDNPDVGYRDKRDESKLMSGFHGYWPLSLEPEPRYADVDEPDPAVRLRELVDTAHENGVRIVFDLALNHVHEDHTYCSENPDWCDSTCICGTGPGCGWDPGNGGITCQFDYFLPDLNYRNHAIVERVIDDTLEIIETYDVDGLRIDAARHMDHVIMRTLRLTLRDRIEAHGGAPFYLVGETFTDDRSQIMDYVADYELHGQFDFAMRSAIRWVFGPGNGSFRDLDDAVAASAAPSGYGEAVWWMSPFFGNHDIDRFATVIAQNDQGPWGDTPDLMAAGPDATVDQWDIVNRMSMAFAFLLTYKGIPLMYYGDEIGLAGSQDPDNRRMMFWELNANQGELLGRVQALGQARRTLPALRHGERRELWKDDTLYVYARGRGAGEAVIVAMNKGATRTETVTIPIELGLDGQTLEGVTNPAKSITVSGGTMTITLDPWEYVLLH